MWVPLRFELPSKRKPLADLAGPRCLRHSDQPVSQAAFRRTPATDSLVTPLLRKSNTDTREASRNRQFRRPGAPPRALIWLRILIGPLWPHGWSHEAPRRELTD